MANKGKSQKVNKKGKQQNVVSLRSQPRATVNKTGTARLVRPVQAVCSLTDPFCEHARAGKYFDINGGRSLSYPVRTMITLATNAGGEAALMFLPNYSCAWQQVPSALATGLATFGNVSATSGLVADVANYRLVSWGFKFMHMTTPLTASGMVAVRGFSAQNGVSYQQVQCLTMNADVIANIALQDCKEVAVVGKRANTTSTFYVNPSTTYAVGALPATYVGNGWDAYTICIQGGPASTNCLTIELFQNFEIVIDDNNATAQLMTLPPTSNDLITKASAIITSSAKSVFERGVEYASTHLKSMALKTLANMVGGPAAGRAAALMVD